MASMRMPWRDKRVLVKIIGELDSQGISVISRTSHAPYHPAHERALRSGRDARAPRFFPAKGEWSEWSEWNEWNEWSASVPPAVRAADSRTAALSSPRRFP
jgi:hypothetical protein